MIPHDVYYQLAIVGFLWLCLMLHSVWPSQNAESPQLPTAPLPPRSKRQRTREPKPFVGLTQRPPCAACAHDAHHPYVPPLRRPDPMPPTHRRPCTIDTSRHVCPHDGCDYHGWPGLGNLRVNGHPSGDPWRQLYCPLLPRLLFGDARDDLSRQTPGGGADCPRAGLSGRRLRHSRHGPRLRGRPQYGAAVVGGSGGPAPSLFTAFPV